MRFRDHAARIVRTKCDFKFVAMWETTFRGRTEFVYVLEWSDEAAKVAAWSAFMADEGEAVPGAWAVPSGPMRRIGCAWRANHVAPERTSAGCGGVTAAKKCPLRKTKFVIALQGDHVVQRSAEKYSAFYFSEIMMFLRYPASPERGASRSSRALGAGCGGRIDVAAWIMRTNDGDAHDEVVGFWHPGADAKLVTMRQ